MTATTTKSQANGHHVAENGNARSKSPPPTSSVSSAGILSSSTLSQEERLREYSKELYDYTMGLLDEVKSDEVKKSAPVLKTYVLKRTVSDVGPRKGDNTPNEKDKA